MTNDNKTRTKFQQMDDLTIGQGFEVECAPGLWGNEGTGDHRGAGDHHNGAEITTAEQETMEVPPEQTTTAKPETTMAEKKITTAEKETTVLLADQSTTAEEQTTTVESAGLGHIVIFFFFFLSTQSLQVHIASQTKE